MACDVSPVAMFASLFDHFPQATGRIKQLGESVKSGPGCSKSRGDKVKMP